MKKRKPLKLEKQQSTAANAFQSRCRNVAVLMQRLSVFTGDMWEEQKGHEKDWTYVGSMAAVEEHLVNLVNFLTNGEGVEK